VPLKSIWEEATYSLATVPPTVRQRRLTAALIGVVALAFASVAPFVPVRLPRVDGFIPAAQSAIAITDSVTAVLLFGHFAVTRSRALLILACGYLFSALVVIAQTLTFPGAFAPTGLLGANAQSAAWLYLFWHFGFGAAVLAYAALKDRVALTDQHASAAPAVWLGVATVAIVAAALTWSAAGGHDILPVLVVTESAFAPRSSALSAVNLALSTLALGVLWVRQRSVLDRWLLVAMSAAVAEAGIITLVAASRYTVSFYSTRLFAVVVSTSVLAALLWESARLYVRLAAAVRALQRERANKLMSLEVVVASVAHEIKQPLTVIATRAGIVQRLLGRPQPDLDAARRNLQEMERASFSASEVFESIRALFRNPAQEKQSLDLNELVLTALRTLSGELNERGIGIHLELASDLRAVLGHKGQLHEVLLNIVQNAIDAMDGVSDRPRELRVTTSLRGREVTLSIEDTGVGIARDRLASLFEAFVTTKARGTGLGLGICRLIIDRHDGQLSASSDLGKGTRFDVTLPVQGKAQASAAA
jgi:signal transduction histidine kinase